MSDGGGSILHTTLGVCGNIVTIAFFGASTLKPAWLIVKQKGTSNIVTCRGNQLFVFMLFNCLLWVFYGLPINRPNNFWVILTNSVGAVLALAAIGAYYHFTSRKERLIVVWEMETFIALFLIMILLTVCVNTNQETRVLVVGTICCFISSCMHLALLSEMALAWNDNDLKHLHPVPSAAGFLKGALWTAYGWSARDAFIMVPNGIGVIIGIVQLILCIVIQYCKHENAIPKRSISFDHSDAARSNEIKLVAIKQTTHDFWEHVYRIPISTGSEVYANVGDLLETR